MSVIRVEEEAMHEAICRVLAEGSALMSWAEEE